MRRLLNSLFAPVEQADKGINATLLERTIERAVDASDPRLRALPGYRKQLRAPVEAALRHLIALVERLPEPLEISRRAYRSDPRLRAFFVSPEHMQTTIGRCTAVCEYLRAATPPEDGAIYGLLSMSCEEKNVLGMDLRGETLQREVAQVAVNFSDHQYLGASASEPETRRHLTRHGFDFLVEKALQGIVAARGKKAELERQRQLLQRELLMTQARNWGPEPVSAAGDPRHADLAALESKIQSVETELLKLRVNPRAPEHSLEQLAATLGDPAHWIDMRDISLELNQMSIKTGPACAGTSYQLELTELRFPSGNRRVVVLARFPVQELPPRRDFLAEAERLLR
jgi:hypothetical protein